jgi:hypothetical protein
MSDDYDTLVSSQTSRFSTIFSNPPSPKDLSPQIVSQVKANPNVACAEALATSLITTAKHSPQSSSILIHALIDALPSTTTIIITDEDAGYTNESFDAIFLSQLSDFLGNALHETQLHIPKQGMVAPTNTVLASAVFSAEAAKHGLIPGRAVYSFARQGLQLPDAMFEEDRKEIVAIGACLQLLIAGKVMVDKWLAASDGIEKITAALESLKEKDVIKYPKAKELLQKTIDQSKTGFANPLHPVDVWKMLFP